MLNDSDYLRYGRQLLMPGWGEAGQLALATKSVAIIGLGGLGVPVLANLAGSGVGRLMLVDGDTLSLSNLHRQWIYRPDQVGLPKVQLARAWARTLNPGVRIDAFAQMADQLVLDTLLPEVDLVLDCTDSLESRHLINAACVGRGVPLISGAAIGWQGQLQAVLPGAPCFACFSPPGMAVTPARCAEQGVAPPVVSAVGSLQATLALALLLGRGIESGTVHRFDGENFSWRQFSLAANPDCPICGGADEPDH